jgi:hypothetical protein
VATAAFGAGQVALGIRVHRARQVPGAIGLGVTAVDEAHVHRLECDG